MRRALVLGAWLIAILAQVSEAGIPKTMSYQGVLKETDNSIVADGDYDFTFTLYDVETGGDPLWQESQNLTVTKGIFNAILGSIVPLNLPFHRAYWLGMSVGADPELVPRVALTASPYALRAEFAEVGADADWQINIDDMHAAVPGNVGIGTVNPTAKLHVEVGGEPDSLAVYGLNKANGNWGYLGGPYGAYGRNLTVGDRVGILGHNNWGVYGISIEGGNWGGLGGPGWGAYGFNEEGPTYGALGGYSWGVVGQRQCMGALGGLEYGVYSDDAAYFAGMTTMGGFKLESGAIAGHVLTSDGDGVGTWQFPGVLTLPWSGVANSATPGLMITQNGTGNTGVFFANRAVSGGHVVHAEVTGTGEASPVAVYGRSTPWGSGKHGIGGQFIGGLKGVDAKVISTGGDTYNSFYGVHAVADGNWGSQYGVCGSARVLNEVAYGVYGGASGSGKIYGVYGIADVGTGTAYGVYGVAEPDGSNPKYAGYFDGVVQVTDSLIVRGDNLRAGLFESDHPDHSTHVLHAEYTGGGSYNTTGVYGKSIPADNYGTGGFFDGGRRGVVGQAWGTGDYLYTGVYGIATAGASGTAVAVFGSTTGPGTNYAGYFNGALYATSANAGIKAFKIDHPLDPANKYLSHSSVESPEMMNIYNGNIVLDFDGGARVDLPDWFEALNRDFRYQLTAIGAPGPNLYVAQEIEGNRFRIAGGEAGMKVSWQVTGVRHDPLAEAQRVQVEQDKSMAEVGRYLNPELYGLPESMAVVYLEEGNR
ncbi:MAG: hypothetical protein GY835_25350 [bacterium]|nr:hypothetical protein [bacterium]